MNSGQYVLSQLLDSIHREQFHRCVARYGGDYKVQHFTCWQQFVCLVFAQLTWRESLRDIEACLNSRTQQLYHLGLRAPFHRSTMADALAMRDWRIFADLAQHLIGQARRLYANEPLVLDLQQTVYALDASTIDLCLSLYPWARFDRWRSGIKLHTQLELHSHLPAQILVSLARYQENLWLDQLLYEPGAFYLMDRGYMDFKRLYAIEAARAWFVVRAKKTLSYHRQHSQPVNAATGLRSDQIITLKSFLRRPQLSRQTAESSLLRRPTGAGLVFLTNHFGLPALTVAQLYQQRWQVELFFRWLKQHLRIKAFYGTSANAVRTQLWVAVCVYALVAILKKRISSNLSLYQILQVLSVSVFEKTPLPLLFQDVYSQNESSDSSNQLLLFE
jgi:IS4 transposase